MATELTTEQREELESALLAVQETQEAFWDAMRDLEDALGEGVELDDRHDYSMVTVDELREDLERKSAS